MDSKHKWLGSLALLTLLATGTATADGGPYLGASIGATTIDENFDGVRLDTNSTAYRFVGGVQFGDLLGLEVGYQDFGDLDETIVIGPVSSLTRLSAKGWTFGGTLGVPITDQFSLFGRAGVFFWDAEVIVDGFSIDVPEDDNPYYGAGARVDVSPNLTLVGDWSRYELDDVDTDVISIGFHYYFGN